MLLSIDPTVEQARDFCYYYGVNCYKASKKFFDKSDNENAWRFLEESEKSLITALEYSPEDTKVLEKLIDVYHRQMVITELQGNFWGNYLICFSKLKPIDERLRELKTQAGQNAPK